MWESLSLPWQACMDLAWEAYCDDCYPIGAVVTDSSGAILSRGRNRVYPSRLWTHPMPGVDLAHAEMDALFKLDYVGIDPHACVLYTSLEPCPMCMSTFYMSGLRTLHFAARDPFAGSTDLLGKNRYLSLKPIRVHGPLPVLETPILAVTMEQYYSQYSGVLPGTAYNFFERHFEYCPAAMDLAERLYRLRLLADLRASRASASLVYDEVARLAVAA